MRRACALLLPTFMTAAAGFASSAAEAQPIRKSVVVSRPADMPRRAADIAADGVARKVLVETVISERMSPALLQLRGDEIRNALEPLDALLGGFSVVNRESLDGNREKLLVEADVDIGAVLLRLVTAKVLTISPEPPSILLVPGPNTSIETVKNLRSRLRATLVDAGLELPAVEQMAPRFAAAPTTSSQGVAAMTRQLTDARVDLLAVVSMRSQQAPSSVGGVVLDSTLAFTVVRPRNNMILAEKTLTTRGAGATRLLAEQAVLDDLGPAMARELGGQLCTAVFAGANLIEPAATLRRPVSVDVFNGRSSLTSALVDFLVDNKLQVKLDSARPSGATEIRNLTRATKSTASRPVPTDRLAVSGDATVESLYRLFGGARFGPGGALSASVIEYGDDYIGVEVTDGRTAPAAPKTPKTPKLTPPPPPSSPSASATVAAAADVAGPRPPLQLHKRIS
jgi:hypothetical protein